MIEKTLKRNTTIVVANGRNAPSVVTTPDSILLGTAWLCEHSRGKKNEQLKNMGKLTRLKPAGFLVRLGLNSVVNICPAKLAAAVTAKSGFF